MSLDEDKRDRILREALSCRIQLVAYARAIIGNYSSAEDAVQEALMVVFRKYDQFQEGTSMLAWCRSIVRLEILRTLQKNNREKSLLDQRTDDSIHLAFSEYQEQKRESELDAYRDALSVCMRSLPDRTQSVLKCRYVEKMSYQEISERLGISLESVRKTLFRTKKQLRSCVETKIKVMQ